jgi:hypothetical protein
MDEFSKLLKTAREYYLYVIQKYIRFSIFNESGIKSIAYPSQYKNHIQIAK